MSSYLCARGHHFHSATPTCPTPGCTAEVRPTKVHPFQGKAPLFERLKPLSESAFMSDAGRDAGRRSRETAAARRGATPAPAPAAPESTVKHSIRWWAVVPETKERIRRNSSMPNGAWGWDVTCSCGWDSRTGGAIMASVERMVDDHKAGRL